MANLITLTQQQATKPISQNWATATKVTGGTTNFDQLAQEVEEKELKNLLGIALFQDMQANPTDAKYVDLLNGSSFVCGDDTITFKGVRYMLAYLNFSRYVDESYVSDSFTGFVSKNRQEANSLTEGQLRRVKQEAREIALQEFQLIKKFLNEESETYDKWHCETKKIYLPRMSGIRKTFN